MSSSRGLTGQFSDALMEVLMTRYLKRLSRAVGLAAIALAATGPHALAQSAPNLKPGFWEESMERMASPDGPGAAAMKEAQAALANLPPEQRRMMEKMMADQGVSLTSNGGGVKVTQKTCIRPERASLDRIAGMPEGCSVSYTRRRDAWSVTGRCEARDGQPASQAVGIVTLEGSTAYSGDFTMTQQGVDGAGPVKVKTRGRWISEGCSAVKPD